MQVCHYCRKAPGRTVDHIVPRSLGGLDIRDNTVPACEPCNLAKAASYPTCGCARCQQAIYIHENGLAKLPEIPSTPCPTCGFITVTPDDCGWCAAEVRA